ncbi:MAG: GNAT family N-acetyltransferase [Lachnospiraceae bacterium]|nr:GNAT family N-acetyltransferase [Lachnospiraceae bacterium]
MSLIYDTAEKDDINELIRMRIAYITEDTGSIADQEREALESRLQDYFERKLGTELIAFIARDGNRIVSAAYLHIVEMPANAVLPNGLYGEVLSVYTEPEYRGRGLCTALLKDLIKYAGNRGLGRIDLSATEDGYAIYAKAGFKDKGNRYREMRYTF